MRTALTNWIKKHVNNLLLIRKTPEAIAIGVATGVFFGFTPLFGLKTLLAIMVTWLLRGSKMAAAIAVTLHDVFLPILPILLRLEYDVGYWLLSNPHELPPHLHMHHFSAGNWMHWSTFLDAGRPVLVGSIVVGAPIAVLTYFIVRLILVKRAETLQKHLTTIAKQTITPCLWFNENAEEAIDFYVSIFKNSRVKGKTHYTESAAEASGKPQGSLMTAVFELEGQEFMALNGGPHFKFNPSISFFVSCETEDEIDALWKNLSHDGNALMELNRCEDRYGVSWQLMLGAKEQKIAPALLFTRDQAGRAQEAMEFYASIFEHSKITSIARDEKTQVILHAQLTLAGQRFVALESPIDQPYSFTPAISFIVNCDTQAEIDRYWEKLSVEKDAEQCGWLKDKFQVSWQIVPRMLPRTLLENDSKKSEQLMSEVLKMKKLDLQTLERAAHL